MEFCNQKVYYILSTAKKISILQLAGFFHNQLFLQYFSKTETAYTPKTSVQSLHTDVFGFS